MEQNKKYWEKLFKKKKKGWLVVFDGISTLECYLMPNPVYTYILNTYDSEMVSSIVK